MSEGALVFSFLAISFFGGMFIAWRVQRRNDPYVAAARARRAARRERRSTPAPAGRTASPAPGEGGELDGGRFRGLDRNALLDHMPDPHTLGRQTLDALGWTPAQIILFDARSTLDNNEHNPLNVAVPGYQAVVEDMLSTAWDLLGGGDPAPLHAFLRDRGARDAFSMLLGRAAGSGRDPEEFGALFLDALDKPLADVTDAVRGYAPALQRSRELVPPPGRYPALSSRMPDLFVLAHRQAARATSSPEHLARQVTAAARGVPCDGPFIEALRCYGGVYDHVFGAALDHYRADTQRLRPTCGQDDAVAAFDTILDAAVVRGERTDRAAELLLTTLANRVGGADRWISERIGCAG